MSIKSILIIVLSCTFMLCMFSLNGQELKNEVQFSERKWMPGYATKKAGNTTIFQGNRRQKKYFEGWYFKMVSDNGTSILSVIPGISLSSDGKEQHAFIQLIDGKTAKTSYYSFPIEKFSFSKSNFAIKIGNNYFSDQLLVLDIHNDSTSISGWVEMKEIVPYKPKKIIDPGIMGWYRFVPFMECYHGVVSLTHGLEGGFSVNQKDYDFKSGKGYIEKDWGSSMPSYWIWMQSNNFEDPGTSFMLSIANIPWIGKSFDGFLGFLYHEGKTYNFATYKRSKLHLAFEGQDSLLITIKNRNHTFFIEARNNQTGLLKAPVNGAMDRRIPESVDAMIKITLLDKKGNVVYTDSTEIAGLEMVGAYQEMAGWIK